MPTTSSLNVFEEAQAEFEGDYPDFAKFGWGPSVHAEVWNGRHAMFGWVFLCATAYAKGHGLFPGGDSLLDLKEWGTLATISGKNTISNERAIILIANAHCFAVGLMATLAPNAHVDPLMLDPAEADTPSYQRAIARQPLGVLPDMGFKNWGLTDVAEQMNGTSLSVVCRRCEYLFSNLFMVILLFCYNFPLMQDVWL